MRVESQLAGQRVFPDISVLLTGLLDDGSDSSATLTGAASGTLLLSDHTEGRARAILRAHGPHLLPAFNDALLRIGTRVRIERVGTGDRSSLPAQALGLSVEDQQVLADALLARAQILVTHDSAFYPAAPEGLAVRSPATLNWDPLDGRNFRLGTEGATFIGWFLPNWSSEAVDAAAEQFYFFEISGFVRAYYESCRRTARLEWRPPTGVGGSLRIPMNVGWQRYHFVAAVMGLGEVYFFVDGVRRGKRVRLGLPPANATFHPFMSATSEHQISGGCHFRVEPRPLGEKELRRLWRAHSTRLSDGEIRFTDWSSKSLLVSPP